MTVPFALRDAIPKITGALFALVCITALWRVLATIGLRVPFDSNEGWNAYHAYAAMSGRGLYPGGAGFFVNNYPPLSFYIFGAAGKLVGHYILAGRVISLAAFIFVAAGLGRLARFMGASATAQAFAPLFFMVCLLVGSDYVGMNDPELFGHAIDVTALVLLLENGKRVVLAALLFVLALFVKHNLVALPLAVSIWLLLYERRRGVEFAVAGLASGLTGLLAFRLVYGTNLFSVLASPRTYSLDLLATNLETWSFWGMVPLVALVVAAIARPRDKFVIFAVLYAGIALAIAIAFCGGAGVDANVFFDADMALSLALAVALDRLGGETSWWPAAIGAGLLFPLGMGIYAAAEPNWRDSNFWMHPLADDAEEARTDIAFLAVHRGSALCEMLSLCFWAGKAPQVDVFNMGEAFATGARSDEGLVRLVANRSFAAIQLDSLEPFALGPHVRAAMLRAYRVDHSDGNGVFLVPR